MDPNQGHFSECLRLLLEDGKHSTSEISSGSLISTPICSSSESGNQFDRTLLVFPSSFHVTTTKEDTVLFANSLAVLLLLLNIFKVKFAHKILQRNVIGTSGNLLIEMREEVQTLHLTLKDEIKESGSSLEENRCETNENHKEDSDNPPYEDIKYSGDNNKFNRMDNSPNEEADIELD